jgi:uncharacterized protein YceK
MQMTDGGPNAPMKFLYPNNADETVQIQTGFVSGLNTITAIVNNTGDGIYGAPCSLSCAGPTNFGFIASVTYQTIANPAPAHPGLTIGPNGVLYGVTEYGGGGAKGCCGTVFALTPPASGQAAWTKATLYAFQGGADGDTPQSGLLIGSDGGLYGTTRHGGVEAKFGTVYELVSPASPATAWTKTSLYSFVGGGDGYYPDGGLIQGLQGSLYGVTRDGGAGSCHDPAGGAQIGCGTVFALTPPAAGQTAWTKSIVYSFKGSDGQSPTSGLWTDQTGALYGATMYGGAHACQDPATGTIAGCGVVFKLTPPASGQTAWTETTLYSFKHDRYGSFPRTALVGDALGHLYGTAELLNGVGGGTVFELKPPYAQKTGWTPYLIGQVPHYSPAFSAQPAAGDLSIDKTGTLYFTAPTGSIASGCGGRGCGAAYSLAPPPKGSAAAWTLTDLYDFQGGDSATGDGAAPEWGLALGTGGTLFGVTSLGGTGNCNGAPDLGCGTAFSLTPPAAGETGWAETVPYRFQGAADGYSP